MSSSKSNNKGAQSALIVKLNYLNFTAKLADAHHKITTRVNVDACNAILPLEFSLEHTVYFQHAVLVAPLFYPQKNLLTAY